MTTIDLNQPIHIHFIGIGGISMSGLAELLHSKGFVVSGSDRARSPITERLEADGIRVCYGQRASNLTDDIDLAVYTAAVHPDNPEYAACVEKGIPLMDRAELLGQISHAFPIAIGVSGTHGKTTTTSMIALMLLEAGMDPTISLGGMLDAIGGNLRIGRSDNFLFEACEYTNSFLKFYPSDEVILNIDKDHLDFFKDLDDIRHSFRLYAQRLPENGCLIINGQIPRLAEIIEGLPCEIVTYGMLAEDDPDDRYRFAARNVTYDELGCPSYDLYIDGAPSGRIRLSVVGEHNAANSLAAIAEGTRRRIPLSVMQTALLHYTGTERRFEKKGTVGGVTIVDDYAHHPTEIKATLTAAKAYPHKTLWCVFQPHTYTRTKLLRAEFAEALCAADKIVLADIFAAREVNTGEISSRDLCEDLKKLGKDAYYFPSFDEIENFLLKNCVNGDLLITMGAGDIAKVGDFLLGK
ncbi:MAG: UDP-N-acetylmuramate--L-alanine ligase [Lachnospiraceae bacterium]|nr:UDP-N-acetylmuramate--L-alanine ligase [Lachnospiraceae bacterium]